MNKKALIAVVVAILLAVSVGIFVLSNKTSKPSDSSSTQTSNTTQNSNVMQKKSLKDLMGLGISQECKFTDQTSGSSGVVQTTGNKVYGEFTSSDSGQTVLSHMISDGVNVYVWMEGQSQGIKMSEKSIDDFSDAPDNQKGSVDLNTQSDYKCGVWAVDNSVFDLPEDLEFQDLSAMMQESQTTLQETQGEGSGDTNQECKACENLSGSAKDQCLQTLGC